MYFPFGGVIADIFSRIDDNDEDYQCIPSPKTEQVTAEAQELDRNRPLTPAASSAHAFWVVVQLPKERFSERLEWDDKLSTLIPLPGNGILGFYNKKADYEKAIDKDPQSVHLVFKCRIPGSGVFLRLLKFMLKEGIIEKET